MRCASRAPGASAYMGLLFSEVGVTATATRDLLPQSGGFEGLGRRRPQGAVTAHVPKLNALPVPTDCVINPAPYRLAAS
jgi:hypothetical protein